MGLPVNSPSEQLAGQNVTLLRNPSTTVQTMLYPSGALSLALSYRQLPGGSAVAGQFARVVVNAASDADAAGQLSTDGAFIPLCQGDDIAFGATLADPITRVDVKTSQAVGAETTLLTIIAGVQT